MQDDEACLSNDEQPLATRHSERVANKRCTYCIINPIVDHLTAMQEMMHAKRVEIMNRAHEKKKQEDDNAGINTHTPQQEATRANGVMDDIKSGNFKLKKHVQRPDKELIKTPDDTVSKLMLQLHDGTAVQVHDMYRYMSMTTTYSIASTTTTATTPYGEIRVH